MTQPAQFQLTFTQKLLGRNYKWWYFIQYQFKLSSSNLAAFLINTTIRTIEFLAIVYIWKINNSEALVITYLALGMVYEKLTFSEIEGQLASFITRGGLTKLLILPTNFFVYMVADNIGFNFIRTSINSIVIFLLSLILFKSDIILSSTVVYLFGFFFISYIIKIFWSLIMGSIAFWYNDTANAFDLIQAMRIVSSMLAGSIIPLNLIFTGSFLFLQFTPFAFLLHHPMQIYLGKYDINQTLLVFAGGITWCIILYFLAKLIFKLGLKRNEAVGL
jgi:ABC-2 type transport system permease protein